MAERFDINKIINTKVNCLTILAEDEPHITIGGNLHRKILCRCDCGNLKSIQFSSVLNGKTKSCGCYNRKINAERMKVSAKKHGMYKTSEHNTWLSMKKRCINKNHKSYYMYGGRGISICDEWVNSFENFFKDMGSKPSKKHSLDRIDNNKGYSKDNCRWATRTEQSRNVRNNVIYTFQSKTKCLGEWVEVLKLTRYKTISFLNKNGAVKH